MKLITEFASPMLQKVLASKSALLAEGKSPEEVSQSIGEAFKLEGDKLKYVLAASDLAKDQSSVRRVLVSTFAEGEAIPAKYHQVEEAYYLVEVLNLSKPSAAASNDRKGPRKGGKGGGPKSSPWGMSPEEKAAKKNK